MYNNKIIVRYENEGEKTTKIRKMNKYVTTKSVMDQIQITEELTIEFQYIFYCVFNLLHAKQKNVKKRERYSK